MCLYKFGQNHLLVQETADKSRRQRNPHQKQYGPPPLWLRAHKNDLVSLLCSENEEFVISKVFQW